MLCRFNMWKRKEIEDSCDIFYVNAQIFTQILVNILMLIEIRICSFFSLSFVYHLIIIFFFLLLLFVITVLTVVILYELSYIHHGLVAHRNKFPSCQFELLVSWSNNEDQTTLKWDRSSYPVAAPGCVSHSLCLKYLKNTYA
jgi:hypothetical protein